MGEKREEELRSHVVALTMRVEEMESEASDLAEANRRLEEEMNELKRDYESRNETCAGIEEQLEETQSLLLLSESRLGEVEAAVAMGGEIHRRYEWFYISERTWGKGSSGKKGSGFNRTEYLALATGPHVQDENTTGYDAIFNQSSPDVEELADDLYDMAFNDNQRVSNILKFVQSLPYIHDCGDDNYVRHPLETLIEGGGDCEDTSVLAAELMAKAGPDGFPVILLTVDTNADDEVDHMMIAVSVDGASGESYTLDGREYYVCETTSRYYRVGQLPSGYQIVDAIPMPRP